MQSNQMKEIIKHFKAGEYDLKIAQRMNVNLKEFLVLLRAYKAVKDDVKNKAIRFSIKPVVWHVYKEFGYSNTELMKLFGYSSSYIHLICSELNLKDSLEMMPDAKKVRKKKNRRVCGSGAVFYRDSEFWVRAG